MKAQLQPSKFRDATLLPSPSQPANGKLPKRRQPNQLPGPRFELGQQSMNLLTADEVAQYLRMPRPTVYFHTKQGRIPSIKIGGRIRYSLVEIEQILKSGIASSDKPDMDAEAEFDAVPNQHDAGLTVKPVERSTVNHVVFAGLAGDDPALQAWMQWSIKSHLNPVVVPLQQCAQFASLSPKIIFIDTASLEPLSEQALTQTLAQIFGDHGQRAKVVFLHEPDVAADLVRAVLRQGPALLCPKTPDQDSLRQIEAFFFDQAHVAELAAA